MGLAMCTTLPTRQASVSRNGHQRVGSSRLSTLVGIWKNHKSAKAVVPFCGVRPAAPGRKTATIWMVALSERK